MPSNPFSHILRSILPPFPPYTIAFLPQMPIRIPPRLPSIPLSWPHTPFLATAIPYALDIFPEKCFVAAASLLAITIALGVVRSRYRVNQSLPRHKRPKGNSPSVPHGVPETSYFEESEHCQVTSTAPAEESFLQIPWVEEHRRPSQLLTPPHTPPSALRPISPTPPTPATPLLRPISPLPSPSPIAVTFPSLAPTSKQETPLSPPTYATSSLQSLSPTPPTSSGPKPGQTSTNAPALFNAPTVNHAKPLPRNLSYTNTSYAALLRAERLLSYERTRRATIEAEARAELSALLRVYWSGCRARSYSKRRRDGCAALKESDPRAQDSQKGEEIGREDRESQSVEEGIRALQRKVMKLKEERVPYEDVLRPLSPTHNRSYVFRDGRFSTLPSSAMSPTHLTSVLSDPAIASCIEELDVSLRLWAGWEWDVDEEWALEVKTQGGGKGKRDDNNAGQGDPLPASKQVALPKLKKLAISTGNVPIGALLERMSLPLGSMEVTRIRIEDDCAARRKAASTRPSMGSTKRRRESLRERRIRVASGRVSRCLDGLDLILQRAAGDIEVCLPVGVQGPASVQGLALEETVHRPER